jgi:hypothetical protein
MTNAMFSPSAGSGTKYVVVARNSPGIKGLDEYVSERPDSHGLFCWGGVLSGAVLFDTWGGAKRVADSWASSDGHEPPTVALVVDGWDAELRAEYRRFIQRKGLPP